MRFEFRLSDPSTWAGLAILTYVVGNALVPEYPELATGVAFMFGCIATFGTEPSTK